MSYKKKKLKRSKINQLKFVFGLALNKFFYNTIAKIKRDQKMRQTEKVMFQLRGRARIIKLNNLKINQWVDQYLTDCMTSGKPVNILTQWCLSSMLKKRFKEQGNTFAPTKKERKILQEEIPAIVSLFSQNGFRTNWWVTFNEAFVESEGIPKCEYMKMLAFLAQDMLAKESFIFIDWESDVPPHDPELRLSMSSDNA